MNSGKAVPQTGKEAYIAGNVYDMEALKAFLVEEAPRWQALREDLRRAGDLRWLVLAKQERRLWAMLIDLVRGLRRLTVRVWSIVAMLQADDPTHQAHGAELPADLVRPPLLSANEWNELCDRAAKAGMGAQAYLRYVVMPEALLLVCASLHVPRRIQLGPQGQGRILNFEGHWIPQAPIERLSFMMLSFYIVQQVREVVRCILTDTAYPMRRGDAYTGGHMTEPSIRAGVRSRPRGIGAPVPLFTRTNEDSGDKPLELIDAVPAPQATPEELAIRRLEATMQLLRLERLSQVASAVIIGRGDAVVVPTPQNSTNISPILPLNACV